MKKKILIVLVLVCALMCSMVFVACVKGNGEELEEGNYKPTGTPMTAEEFLEKTAGDNASFIFSFDLVTTDGTSYEDEEITIKDTITATGKLEGDKFLASIKETKKDGSVIGEYEAYKQGENMYSKEKEGNWKIATNDQKILIGILMMAKPFDDISLYSIEGNKLTVINDSMPEDESGDWTFEITGKDTAIQIAENTIIRDYMSMYQRAVIMYAKIGTATITSPAGLPQ